MYQSLPTRETHSIKDAQILKNLQAWLIVAAHRVQCGRVQSPPVDRRPRGSSQRFGALHTILPESISGAQTYSTGGSNRCAGSREMMLRMKVQTGALQKKWKQSFISLLHCFWWSSSLKWGLSLCWANLVKHFLLKLTQSINYHTTCNESWCFQKM